MSAHFNHTHSASLETSFADPRHPVGKVAYPAIGKFRRHSTGNHLRYSGNSCGHLFPDNGLHQAPVPGCLAPPLPPCTGSLPSCNAALPTVMRPVHTVMAALKLILRPLTVITEAVHRVIAAMRTVIGPMTTVIKAMTTVTAALTVCTGPVNSGIRPLTGIIEALPAVTGGRARRSARVAAARGPPRAGACIRGPPGTRQPPGERAPPDPHGRTNGRRPREPGGPFHIGLQLQKAKKMANITKGTTRKSSSQLAAKADFIINRMTGNPAFPSPVPALSAIQAAVDALRTAMTDALDGGKTATAIKKSRHRELKRLLDQLAGHVASVAEGNELAILSSGFGVRRPSSPLPEPGKPTDVRAAITDHTGRVDLTWAPVAPAVTYHIQWTAGDPSDERAWQLVAVSTRSTAKVTGLPSGQVAYFRVAGIGTKGMGPWSQVASTLVK